MTKLAIFDVDGTLFDGNLGIEFVKKLVKDNVFTEEIGNEIFGWYKKYKSGEIEKSLAVDACYKYYNIGLKNKTTHDIKEIAKLTWEIVKTNTSTFTNPILNLVRAHDYKPVLLSGSPIEMVSLFGLEYSLNETSIIAGISETKSDIYTGNSLFYPGSSEQKVLAINEYISSNKLEINWGKSLAFGDNERDLGILELVKHPFAVNPNDKLEEISLEKGFYIVNESTILDKVKEIID